MKSPKESNENAHSWLNSDTKEYYFLSVSQYTLYPIEDYVSSLNVKGKLLYEYVKEQANNNNYKTEIVEYYLERENSGGWFCDPTSKFYNTENKLTDDPNIQGIFNTLNNIVIVGILSTGQPISTSCCVFICNEWCYTSSGSLYKLGKRIENNDTSDLRKRMASYNMSIEVCI